jgi:hypothetical protein
MGMHRQKSAMQIVLPDSKTEIKIENTITSEFTATVSGHAKTNEYLHRFKLADNPKCPCNEGAQSPEHLMYDCKMLEIQRKTLKYQIKDQRRKLAHRQQRLCSKIFTCIFKIY